MYIHPFLFILRRRLLSSLKSLLAKRKAMILLLPRPWKSPPTLTLTPRSFHPFDNDSSLFPDRTPNCRFHLHHPILFPLLLATSPRLDLMSLMRSLLPTAPALQSL